MTTARELMGRLAGLGVRVEAIDDQLRIDAPRGILTAELKGELAASKSELLALLQGGDGGIRPLPADAIIPLSHGQQRLWALIERQRESGIYNVPTVYRLRGPLDFEALERGLAEIHRRHAILRTTVRVVDGSARQEVGTMPFGLRIVDLTRLADTEERAARVDRELAVEIREPFDLGNGPPWRAALLKLGPADNVLAMTMHHLVFDRFSKGVFLRELEALYAGRHLPELAIQYRDFAHWQQSAAHRRRVDGQMAYWMRRLGGTAELLLPTDRPRSASHVFEGRSRSLALPADLTRELESLSRAARGTMFMTLLAAFHVLLHRHSGQTDQVVCVPAACRNSTRLEALIGYFNNILPIRTDLSGDPSFVELLGRVRRVTMEAHRHQDVPFQQISGVPSLAGTPLTRGMFNFRSEDSADLNLEGVAATPVENRRQQADFDLALYLGIENGTLKGVLDYNARIFANGSIEALLGSYRELLETATANPNARLSAFPSLRRRFPSLERSLAGHPKIDVAALAVRSDAGNAGHLVAYLELNEHDVPSRKELRPVFAAQDEVDPEHVLLVPIDQVPRLTGGGFDFEALAALRPPPLSRKRPDDHYVAPRTALEQELAQIWQRALWLDDRIGVHDNFFDLGGHSLLAVQMIAEIEKRLNRSVPGAALEQLSTIAEFADFLEQRPEEATPALPDGLDAGLYRGLRRYTAAWSGKRTRPGSLVVGLNTDGTKQPVFWCVQRYLNVTQLAKYLGPDQPLYGMRSGHNVMDLSDASIRALASLYTTEILGVQGRGPFLVGGICQAAEIAFEIALQLMASGHEVNLLGLQERFVRRDYPGRIAFFFGDQSDRSPYYQYARPELGWRKYYTGGIETHIIRGGHAQYFQIESNCEYLAMKMQAAFDGAQTDRPGPPEGETKLQRLSAAAYRARLGVGSPDLTAAGDRLRLAVTVRNESTETWLDSERSGVFLGARWLDPKRSGPRNYTPYAHAARARSALPAELKPGAYVDLELVAPIPERRRFTTLEVDLVDEGITWFADAGSQSATVEIRRR